MPVARYKWKQRQSGMEYTIIRSRRKTIAAQIIKGELIIRAPFYVSDREINSFIAGNKKWIDSHLAKVREIQKQAESYKKLSTEDIKMLAEKALKVIPERVRYYAPLIGVTYGRITIRNQRTRWGSCSAKGNLNFNCLLMLAPPEVIDSVVVHELCHRKEMNHSEKFYAEVLRVYPDYPKWNKWLKKNGPVLMAMMG